MAKMGWRSALVDILDSYPHLRYLEDRADTQSILSITVLNRETDTTMTLPELEIIYEGMTIDLSDKFDWDEVNSSHDQTNKEIQLPINRLYD